MPVLDGRAQRFSDTRRRARVNQVIAPWSECAMGSMATMFANGFSSLAYPAANLMLAFPFVLEDDFTIKEAWIDSVANGAGRSVDWAVYDHTYTQVGHVGSTAWTNSTAIQTVSWTQALAPGRYFAAFSGDGTGIGTHSIKDNSGSGVVFRSFGCFKVSTAFPCPTGTVTPVAYGDDNMPAFGFTGATAL